MLVDDAADVFFCTDFCESWVRLALPGLPAQSFAAFIGLQDQNALQDYIQSTEHTLCYAAASVELAEGQLLQRLGQSQLWRVRQAPVRHGDGLSASVLIGPAS